jgi:hypothetical protein
LRLQSDAHALDAYGIAGAVEQHARDPDAGVIAVSHKTGKEVELAIPGSNGCRIEDALYFIRVALPRLHNHADPPQLEIRH